MSTTPFQVADPVLLESTRQADAIHCQLARTDINAFMSYVMRDESTGFPIEQSPIHEAWHELADEYKRLIIWSHVESGKTSQLTIGRTLFELGKNPALKIVILSNVHEQAVKIVRTIARYIEESAELRRVFPKLLKGDPWINNQLYVQRPTRAKDPSVQAIGIHGSILGARVDLVVIDDILDPENCRTEAQRKDLWDWYHATIPGRLTQNARVLVVGTAFHPGDFLHQLAKHPGWTARRFPILDPSTNQTRWPERWSMKRIEEKREELGPMEFARQMLCQARDDSESRFKREWVDKCLERGDGKDMLKHILSIPQGYKVYTGVDLAVQTHASAGHTVLFTIAVHPNKDREVVNIESGRWAGQQIVNKLIEAHRRFKSLVIVENNAAQDFIVQFTRGSSDVPIKPFTTGRNKAHPEFGIESLATEMAGGKWIIPNRAGKCHPEIAQWVQEMLYYDPRAHTGDRLMASWFAREGARMGSNVIKSVFLDLTSR